MHVTLLYFEDCPNWREIDTHLETLAAEFGSLRITRRVVDTPEAAEAVGFRGSPTVLVDGVDPFVDPTTPVGLCCRVYATPHGVAGSPTLEQLREIVARSLRRGGPPRSPSGGGAGPGRRLGPDRAQG